MHKDFLKLLRGYNLESGSNENEKSNEIFIKDGKLISQDLKKEIKISNFIPRFVESQSYSESFGFEWNVFKKTQLDSYTKTNISKDRWESITQKKVESLKSKTVLDVGCGSGRFLEVIAPYCEDLVGIDMSNAVDVSRENLINKFPNVHFLQADLNDMPFKEGSFDLIYSIGVLHHTPSLEKALKSLLKFLKPGGELIIWVYGPRFPLRILPHDIIRYIFCRLDPKITLKFTKIYVPLALKTHSLPGKLGKLFKYFLMWAPNYKKYPIPENMRLDWSILDAFDTFATRIEKNYHEIDVIEKFKKSGYVNVRSNNTPVAVSGCRPKL